LNTISLCQDYEDITHDHNCQMSHILCLVEIRIHHAPIDAHKFIISLKYSHVLMHDGHRLMIMDDIHTALGFFQYHNH
jgi:hypothetical protein